jgi:hypothetical protein
MNKIYADAERIFLDNWNSAYGNKILHILFLINLSEKHGRMPVSYMGSNLDDIFDFNFELIDANKNPVSKYEFIEKDSFYLQNKLLNALGLQYKFYDNDLKSVVIKNYKHFLERREFLNGKLPAKDIKIKGHFFDFELMPDVKIFNKYISIKKGILETLKKKYNKIESSNNVAVHYRGTDFSTHLKHIFPMGLKLDSSYYEASMNIIEQRLGRDVTYHLFSDEIDMVEKIFKGKKIVVHDDTPALDWAAMFQIPNIIQSNSSFCWTAALYNKKISIQPKDGYNYYIQSGSIPYGFSHENAILVQKSISS